MAEPSLDVTTLATLHRDTRERFRRSGIASPELDARLIVEHFTGTSRTDLITRPDTAIADNVVAAINAAVARRIAGEPVHRLLGFREFYGLKLALSAGTLEPRPDTETLVDAVLPFVRDRVVRQGYCRVLDLGTGTGAIALALLSQVPEARALATDISEDALATATRNARNLGLTDRFEVHQSNWFETVSGVFDVIVSNPPYITSNDIASLAPEVRDHDPRAALDGGPDGLSAYRMIAKHSWKHLEPDGIVAVEIGQGQAPDVVGIFTDSGYAVQEVRPDFGQIDRVIVLKRPK